MKVAIIGGGAVGLMTANYLVRNNSSMQITIYDRNKGFGRKILASGNGKCNFMNYKALPSDYNNPEFIKMLSKIASKEDCLNYFNDLGLLFKFDDEGRMYPMTESSDTILSMLMLDFKNVKYKLETIVEKIEVKPDGIVINDNEMYDFAVLSTGSNASITGNKCNDTYKYLSSLNLKMTALEPVLVGLKAYDDIFMLKNTRFKCHLTYYGTQKYEENGEIIFKEDGVSGICVMNASRYYIKDSIMTFDFYPSVSKEELAYKLNARYNTSCNPDYYLAGICHENMIKYLKNKNILKPNAVAMLLKQFTIKIKEPYEMKNAQVSRGGVSLDEVNDNLSLRKYPNIFIGGEMLDIDGRCGGYNLLFAFMCGIAIGKELLRYEGKDK